MTTHKIRKQDGFTLAELTVVLLIGGLLAAAAIVGVPRVLSNYRAGKIIDEFNTAIPAIQTAYQNRTSYTGLTTDQVANFGWLNSNFIEYGTNGKPTGNLLTNWGSITFQPAQSGRQAQVTLTNIPTRECLKISEVFNSDNYLTASINGSPVKNIATSRNVDLDSVKTQCNSTTTNSIVFNFGRA